MAPKPLPKAKAEARLRAPVNDGALVVTLRQLPDDVDAELASGAVLSLLNSRYSKATWIFARQCRGLPVPVVRAVLRRLSEQGSRQAHEIFLLEAVAREAPDERVREEWIAALNGLLELETASSWGSTQQKAKFAALAKQPKLLEAIQAAVVGSLDASMDMLAVLAADGSEASVDALLPCFIRAKDQQDTLKRLKRLEAHAANTPAVAGLLAAIEQRLPSRRPRRSLNH